MNAWEKALVGSETGHELAADPQEAYYVLKALFDDAPDGFAVELAEYSDDPQEIANRLQAMATEIREAFTDA